MADSGRSPTLGKRYRFLRNWNGLPSAMLLGFVAFIVVTGGHVFWPGNIDWLMVGDDGGTHYLGWEFFRRAPLLQLPLGANALYGLEISSSIAYTDSIPLLALLFKPFSPLLPMPFQYHGIWLLLCFLLQAYFAFRLLSLLTDDPIIRLAGTAIFVFAPTLLFRISLSHYASAGQWLVLAALYLYLSEAFRAKAWIGLLILAALVNAYIFVMVGGFYLADQAQKLWQSELRMRRLVSHAAISALVVLFTLWVAGFFMASKYTAGQGFGLYRMNLLAVFNPMEQWSQFLPPLTMAEGEFEGFNYLGLGGLLLLMATPFLLIKSETLASSRKVWVPLLLLAFGSAVFSLSNQVAVGGLELLSIDVPPKLWPLVSTLRSSGRMFWIAYYLILFACLATVILRCERRTAMSLVLVALSVQLVDISAGISDVRAKLVNSPPWISPMQSRAWEEIGRRYERITVVLPLKHYPDYQPIAHFALLSGQATNGIYLARVNEEKLRLSRDAITRQIESGDYAKNTLYVFNDDELWELSAHTLGRTDLRGRLDGFRVLAPGLLACAECDQAMLMSDFDQ